MKYLLLCAVALFAIPTTADAQQILFESNRDGNFEIYQISADGSGLTNLTNNGGLDRQPRWSPDRSQIAFTSDRDGDQDVYLLSLANGSLFNLTEELESEAKAGDGFPQWSPDGTMLAFNSTRDGREDIHVVNQDGTNRLRRTNETNIINVARWSPDSTQILYDASRVGRQTIILMPVDGAVKTDLTVDFNLSHSPRWSPDGTRIVFVSDRNGSNDIFVMNADGSSPVALTNDPASDTEPQWSPDGSRILFISDRDVDTDFYTMSANGTGVLNITHNTFEDALGQWSPDGTRVSYTSIRDGQLDVYLTGADGTGEIQITTDGAADLDPQLSGNFSFGRPPSIASGGVVLSNLLPTVNTVAPRSIITLFGLDISPETVLLANLDSGGRVDTILGGTCVEIGGTRAPMFAVTPTQANVQTPAEALLGPNSVVVIRDCDTPLASRSAVEMVTVEEATPGFFVFGPVTADGFIAARYNATSEQAPVPVAPATSFPNDSFGPSRPAVPGDIVVAFGTGWGATEAQLGTGELATGAAELSDDANVMITFGGIPVASEDLLYVGVTPGTAGLLQAVIRIPANAQPGNNQMVLTAYGKSTPVGPVLPVMAP